MLLYYSIIYIPIWLDLLFVNFSMSAERDIYLHSNMVRFIIWILWEIEQRITKFTFQYG